MESYFELVVETLTAAGYRWYETANFCRSVSGERAGGSALDLLGELSGAAETARRDLRSRHNLGYWLGHDYLGLGVGAVSTIENRRWRNSPSLTGYVSALADGRRPPRETEALSAEVRETERVMLGLRLDEPLSVAEVGDRLDAGELARLERLGSGRGERWNRDPLTARGRYLGDGVTAALLV